MKIPSLKLLLLAARCLHWFNPLVHLIARFAQEDIEAACDDTVVRGQDGAYRLRRDHPAVSYRAGAKEKGFGVLLR